MTYIQPKVLLASFTCPHCGAIAKQEWTLSDLYFNSFHLSNSPNHKGEGYDLRIARCHHCSKYSLWIKDKMFYPDSGSAPFPNAEMPESVKKIYIEAASIHSKSPKGAAALLRLSIQVLCKELGEPGKNINDDIKRLVKKGLPELVQQSLDIVRVTGNDAVHPGQIDTDDPDTVKRLFDLVNIIVEYMIALPKRVSGIYSLLPADKIKGIEDRDK